MKRLIKKYCSFMTKINFKYVLLRNWVKIILFPLWCLFIFTSNLILTLIYVIYYIPRYRTKAHEQMVMDSLRNTVEAFTDKKEVI